VLFEKLKTKHKIFNANDSLGIDVKPFKCLQGLSLEVGRCQPNRKVLFAVCL
jgi:hypothetical protein